jgi:hypothetical protein
MATGLPAAAAVLAISNAMGKIVVVDRVDVKVDEIHRQ